MRVLPSLMRPSIAGAAVLGGQLYDAIHRADLPSYRDHDPSGDFGDPSSPRLRIVALGDSSVTAPGVEVDDSWIRRLAAHFANRYRVELCSVAVGGSKARDVRYTQVPAALATRGDVAILSVGSNDAMRMTPIARYEEDLAATVADLSRGFARITIMGIGDLGTLPRLPSLAKTVARTRGRSVDRAIRRVAAQHRHVVKSKAWGPAWHGFDDDPLGMFSGDLFHASGQGHLVFSRAGIAAVERLMTIVPLEDAAAATEFPGSLESAM